MPIDSEVRNGLAPLLEAYLQGSAEVERILDFEVGYWGVPGLDSDLQGMPTKLSLIGNEVLMELRPAEDLQLAARESLAVLRSYHAAEATGG